MTLGECAKIAACLHAYRHNMTEEFQQTGPNWYDTYVDYCAYEGLVASRDEFDWKAGATRAQMAYIFSGLVLTDKQLNYLAVEDIPDVDAMNEYAYPIVALYKQGIAVGSDDKLSFNPDSTITRSEVSAIIARILVEDLRINLPQYQLEVTKYAKVLPWEYDEVRQGDKLFGVAFLGYGNKGSDAELNAQYYIDKYFPDLTAPERTAIPYHYFEGDEWYLVVPRYTKSFELWEAGTADNKILMENGLPFVVKCNLSDLESNITIGISFGNYDNYSFGPMVDSTGSLVCDHFVMELAK